MFLRNTAYYYSIPDLLVNTSWTTLVHFCYKETVLLALMQKSKLSGIKIAISSRREQKYDNGHQNWYKRYNQNLFGLHFPETNGLWKGQRKISIKF